MDEEALTHFRDTASQLRFENMQLRSSQRRSAEEIQRLRRLNDELLSLDAAPLASDSGAAATPVGQSVAAAGAMPGAAAVASAAEPQRTPATTQAAGASSLPLAADLRDMQDFWTRLADELNQAERGKLKGTGASVVIVSLVLVASSMIVYAVQSDFYMCPLPWQLVGLALFAVVSGLALSLAVQGQCTGLLIGAWMLIAPVVYFLGKLGSTFWQYSGTDLDGDGDVDWHDRLAAFQKAGHSMEMFWETFVGLLPLFILGVGGFAVLWWMGFIQPILQELVVYAFFGVLLVCGLALFVFKIWRNLHSSIMKFFEQFTEFERMAEDILQDIPEHMKKAFNDWRAGGDALGTPLDDRALANLKVDPFLTLPAQPGTPLTDVRGDPFLTGDTKKRRDELQLVCDFADALFAKYKDVNDAFSAFDANNNGLVTKKEFKDRARELQFTGDLMIVFKAIDPGRPTGRPTERLSKQSFRKLKDVHEQRAEAKKELETANTELHNELHGDTPVAELFAEPLDINDPGGKVWTLKRALEKARARAVAKPAQLEAEHTLYLASEVKCLDDAMQSDRGVWKPAIQMAIKAGVPPNRLEPAKAKLKAEASEFGLRQLVPGSGDSV